MVAVIGMWVVKWSKGCTLNHLVFIFLVHTSCTLLDSGFNHSEFFVKGVKDKHSSLKFRYWLVFKCFLKPFYVSQSKSTSDRIGLMGVF